MAKSFAPTPEELSFFEASISAGPATPQDLKAADDSQAQAFLESSLTTELPQGQQELPFYKSIPAAAAKALASGLSNFGKSFGPLQSNPLEQAINPQRNPQDIAQFINQALPSNEGFLENTLARAGKILPFLASGGSSLASIGLRSALGGASGQIAEELGAPEWLQSLAELPAQIAPSLRNVFSSNPRLNPGNSQIETVQKARNLGLNEKEITPLVQSDFNRNILSKIANRGNRTQEALKNSYDAIGRVYGRLSENPEALKSLNANQANKVGSEIQSTLSGMPAGLRNTIGEDLTDLLNNPITGKSLINFYQDVNYYVGKGDRQLGLLKEPITKALGQISPKLGEDFISTNKLYQSYHEIAKDLKPSIVSDFLAGTEPLSLLYGAISGNYPLIAGTIGEMAARKMAANLLLNPRFQNFSRQIVQALNKNKFGVAQKILESMTEFAREEDPDSAVFLQRARITRPNAKN